MDRKMTLDDVGGMNRSCSVPFAPIEPIDDDWLNDTYIEDFTMPNLKKILDERIVGQEQVKKALAQTLYTTFEPCCMCTGAIYWANIGRIVYGLTEEKLLELTGSDEKNPTFNISSRTILAAGQKPIEVLGPFEEIAQAVEEVHRGFWNAN